ncbi:unnamed protein product [Rotaria sordida]|uniref:Uncharacterized protein n=1 Tax=Rotaria sordida TaxID=392033 RepID=A0A813ZUI7_9BILA|nr:unnamed protein product [Rotaria sordida]CAF3817073.1 unnamed protein product [Rotaria sordida]
MKTGLGLFNINFIVTTFNTTDWTLEYGNESNNFLLGSISRTFIDNTCNCAVSSTCQQSLRIGPPNLVPSGLVIVCLPMDDLHLSTLECFYSSHCILTILNYLEYYIQIDGSPPVNFTIPTTLPMIIMSLNSSVPSCFLPTTPIGTIIDESFIEELDRVINYENYYAMCASSVCRYEYVRRKSLLYTTTTLVGLYGSLTIDLRIVIWNAVRIYFRNHNTIRQAWT